MIGRVRDVLGDWGARLRVSQQRRGLRRDEHPILVFFHGHSLAHTIRPLVMARELRLRGYPVELAGRGRWASRIRGEGFTVHDVVTMPQSRMDELVGRGDYAYYDLEWIDRCVASERAVIRKTGPELVIADMKPTMRFSAACEGVDLARIVPGYGQPGYPHPIPLVGGFSSSIGPFDEYGRRIREQLKENKQLYLVADVPELHPPGTDTPGYYHYVGPLVEEGGVPADPDQPWTPGGDPAWPLVYVTCGSSGRPPSYLEGLVCRAAGLPYRVLVTTAGRWDAGAPRDNVRIVDYVPADEVLREAALVVCTGGIGTIYHALRHGLPVVGAPEHLDQEYHLNRVHDLGLGLKMELAELAGEGLWRWVDEVLDERGGFRGRCDQFAAHVQRWRGGSVAADVVDAYFLQEEQEPIPVLLQMTDDEFVRYLARSGPPSLDEKRIRRMLRRGRANGMPHRRAGDALLYDKLNSWNWLYGHDAEFFEADYRSLEHKRGFFLEEGPSARLRSRYERVTYLLHFTYSARVSSLANGSRALAFVPVPVEGPFQGPVEVLACDPPEVQRYLLPRLGFIYGFPMERLSHANGSSTCVLRYSCRVTVRERRFEEAAGESLEERSRRRYLALDVDDALAQRLRTTLEATGVEQRMSDEEKARRLYRFLVETKRFKKTMDWERSLAACAEKVLNDDGGHCASITYAYIALCRQAEVPAREVCGTLLGYPVEEGAFESRSYREGGLFSHTWSEVFLEAKGWVPVEFHPIVIGENALTTDNVTDPDLRRAIERNNEPYREYYFGNLDTHHIVYATSASRRMPLCLVEDGGTGCKNVAFPYECTLRAELADEQT